MRNAYLLSAALAVCACIPVETPLSDVVVAFTFDDGHWSVYDIAYPLMRARDTTWGCTHFLPATYPGTSGLVTVEQLREMERSGWESGAHGLTHANLSAVTLEQARRDIASSDSFLIVNGLSHDSYAYAFGNYNDSVQPIVEQYFRNVRTSHDYKYLDGVNRLALGAYDSKAGHTADDHIGRIEEARMWGSPLVVFCFHVIVPDSVEPDVNHDWWTSQSAFEGLLDYMKARGMRAVTIRDAVKTLCE